LALKLTEIDNIQDSSFLLFLLQTFLISLSGVIAPGPLTAVTLGKGSSSPNAGALIAVGHGIIEMPLIALLVLGFGSFVMIPWVKIVIAMAGGAFLIYTGIDMLRSSGRAVAASGNDKHGPVLAGIILSAGNPYFLIWWAAVGVSLIYTARTYGIIGIAIFSIVHWLCDLGWLWFLSAMSYNGGKFFGKIFQKVLFIICGFVLIGFGGKFIIGIF
jgi:threonine/homoserine/homoserine lactone efflux protein